MKQLLSELFSSYYMDVYTYLYSLSHDASLSEDLASDVFLEVVRSISTFRGESDIRTWLFSIARHKWFAYLRRKNRQIRTESIHTLYDSTALSAPDQYGETEMAQLLAQILDQETETTRTVLQMRLDGYSYFEIAAALHISENSARVIFFRLKTKIKKHLEKEGFRHE